MKVTLPEKVTGAQDALFVLEVEFPVASAERGVEVEVTGPVEPLDLSGSARGGSYRVPVGLERLHVPMRVVESGAGQVTVAVKCTEGPEEGISEERVVPLEAPTAAEGGARGRRWLMVAAAILVVGLGGWGLTKLGGGSDGVPKLVGLEHEQAEQVLRDAGYTPKPRYVAASNAEQTGRVIRTIPAAGEAVPDSKVVEIVLGRFEDDLTPVPTVVGELAEHAEEGLVAAGYEVETKYQDPTDAGEAGKVVNQSPEGGTPLAPGSRVEIWVAKGEPGVPVEPPPVEPPPVEPPPIEPPPIEPPPIEPPPIEPPPVDPTPLDPTPLDPTPVDPTPLDPTPVDPTPLDPTPLDPTPVPPVDPVPVPAVPAVPTAAPDPLVAGADGRFVIPDMTGWDGQTAKNLLRDAGLVPLLFTEPAATADLAGKVMRQRPPGGTARDPASMIYLIVGEGTAAAPPVEPAPIPPTPLLPEVVPPVDPTPIPPVDPTPIPPVDPTPIPPVDPTPIPPVDPTPIPPVDPTPIPPVDPTPIPPVDPTPVRPGVVPDVVGASREKAEGLIRQAGFLYRIRLKVTEYPPDGTVLGQDPGPGGTLAPGAEIVLEVAQAPADAAIPVPGVVGMERSVAERMLREAGFLVNVTLGGGGAGQQGLVLDQAPKGKALAPRRSWIEIVVASGTGPTRTARGGPPAIGPTRGPLQPGPGSSGGLSGPPTTAPGPARMPPPTRQGPQPLPPVALPAPDSPKTAKTPVTVGMGARDAIASVVQAGLIPIIQVDRSTSAGTQTVIRQAPEGGVGALPGDLVRLTVAIGSGGAPFVDLPMAVGALATRTQRLFAQVGVAVEVIPVRVPGHPYAGTGRVVAQYPVGRIPRAMAGRITLWIVER